MAYRAGAAALSAVASTAASQQLLAANPKRSGLLIVNTDANALHVKFGATAALGDFSVIVPASGGFYQMAEPIYTGRIDGIWAADGAGSAFITELSDD